MSGEGRRPVCKENAVVLCQDAVDHLWVKYGNTRSEVARNALVEVYMPFVAKRASLLSRRLPRSISVEDLCSAGYEGLIHSVEAFDVTRNARFETFCRKRVLGAMHDWLRATNVHSRIVQTFLTRRSRSQSSLSVTHGRRATDDELADDMGIHYSRFAYLSRVARSEQEVQMSVLRKGRDTRSRGDTDEAPWEPADTKPNDPASTTERQLVLQKITHALSRNERLIITLHYCEGLTFRDIGTVLDLSESRVSQMHTHLVGRLRIRLATDPENHWRGGGRVRDDAVRQSVASTRKQPKTPAA